MDRTYAKEQGRLIQSLRKQRLMTLDDLSDLTNIPNSTLSYFEHGTSLMSPSILLNILEALEYPINEFIDQVNRGLDPVYIAQLKEMYEK